MNIRLEKNCKKNIGLDFDAINPKHGAKFSPNLYKWIVGTLKAKPLYCQFEKLEVYKDGDGCLYIGFARTEDKGWLFGNQLFQILGGGQSLRSIFAIDVTKMTPLKNFWHDYIKRGRCAIDKQHKQNFIGDETRWLIAGNARACQWCGNAMQKLTKRKEVVIHEVWA